MSISNMIHIIRKRPGMYLGGNIITALSHFLDGYRAAEREIGIGLNGKMFPLDFRYMHEFVGMQLNANNNLGWCRNILEFCSGDEEKALNQFFEFYDEFIHIRMKKY